MFLCQGPNSRQTQVRAKKILPANSNDTKTVRLPAAFATAFELDIKPMSILSDDMTRLNKTRICGFGVGVEIYLET